MIFSASSVNSVVKTLFETRDGEPAHREIPTPCLSIPFQHRHAPKMTNGLIRIFTLSITVTPAEAGAHTMVLHQSMDPGLRRDDEWECGYA